MNSITSNDILDRIIINPGVMTGKPVIRGTRLTVQFILGLLSSGMTTQEILSEYSGLQVDDIHACIRFAAEMLETSDFVPLAS